MSDLISTSYAKAFMRISTSVNDSLIGNIISAVSGQIERHCDRRFNQDTYRQWLDGTGDNAVRVPQYPISRLYRVATNRICVGRIQYTGSDRVATPSLSSSGQLTLANIRSSDGSENIKDIDTTSKTLTALSTSVGAEPGWSITIIGSNGDQPMRDLRPFSDWGTDDNTVELTIPCEGVRARIQSETADTIEIVDDYAFSSAGHRVMPVGGGVDFVDGAGMPWGRSNIFVWWKAGYSTIPAGLKQITAKMVKEVFDWTAQDSGIESERIGDYNYKIANPQRGGSTGSVAQTVDAHAGELAMWCRKEL